MESAGKVGSTEHRRRAPKPEASMQRPPVHCLRVPGCYMAGRKTREGVRGAIVKGERRHRHDARCVCARAQLRAIVRALTSRPPAVFRSHAQTQSFACAAALYVPVRVRADAADDKDAQQREHHGHPPVMLHPSPATACKGRIADFDGFDSFE